MTAENAQYHLFAVNMRRITGLGATEAGSLPDRAHLASGGYHVGVEDMQAVGRYDTDYSTRQSRDRLDGTNDSSAFDIGDDWPHGGRAAWLRWNNFLLNSLVAGDPALTAVRAVNISRDGIERKRFDTLHRDQGLINSTDGVTYHTHGETWRNTRGTVALDRAFRRIEQMAVAAVANTPLPPEGSDMELTDVIPETGGLTVGSFMRDTWTNSVVYRGLTLDAAGVPQVHDRDRWRSPHLLGATVLANRALVAKVEALTAAFTTLANAINDAGGSVDTAEILAGVDVRLAALAAEQRDAVADLGEGGAAQVRADAE